MATTIPGTDIRALTPIDDEWPAGASGIRPAVDNRHVQTGALGADMSIATLH